MQGRQGGLGANASQMIIEDQLKNIISKNDKKQKWKCSDNKLLPRSQHSVFGDFPKTHMPEKMFNKQTTAKPL